MVAWLFKTLTLSETIKTRTYRRKCQDNKSINHIRPHFLLLTWLDSTICSSMVWCHFNSRRYKGFFIVANLLATSNQNRRYESVDEQRHRYLYNKTVLSILTDHRRSVYYPIKHSKSFIHKTGRTLYVQDGVFVDYKHASRVIISRILFSYMIQLQWNCFAS